MEQVDLGVLPVFHYHGEVNELSSRKKDDQFIIEMDDDAGEWTELYGADTFGQKDLCLEYVKELEGTAAYEAELKRLKTAGEC